MTCDELEWPLRKAPHHYYLAQMTKLVLYLILFTKEYLPSSNDQEVEMRTRARDRQVLYTTLND